MGRWLGLDCKKVFSVLTCTKVSLVTCEEVRMMSWVLGAGKTTPPARSCATTSATPAMSGSAENAAAQDWSRASTWSRTAPGHSSEDRNSAKSLWQTRSRKGRRQFLTQVSSRVRVNRAVLLFLPMHWCSLANQNRNLAIFNCSTLLDFTFS